MSQSGGAGGQGHSRFAGLLYGKAGYGCHRAGRPMGHHSVSNLQSVQSRLQSDHPGLCAVGLAEPRQSHRPGLPHRHLLQPQTQPQHCLCCWIDPSTTTLAHGSMASACLENGDAINSPDEPSIAEKGYSCTDLQKLCAMNDNQKSLKK